MRPNFKSLYTLFGRDTDKQLTANNPSELHVHRVFTSKIGVKKNVSIFVFTKPVSPIQLRFVSNSNIALLNLCVYDADPAAQ